MKNKTWKMLCLGGLIALSTLWGQAAETSTTRTLGEWQKILAGETLPKDAAFQQILRGAAIDVSPYAGKKRCRKSIQGNQLKDLKAYEAFMEERGEALLDTLLRSDKLTPEDQPYQTILHGVAMGRHHHKVSANAEQAKAIKTYVDTLNREGKSVLRKAYLEGVLSAEELDTLRRYAMQTETRCTGGGILPFHLELTRSSPWKPGETAPDFTLLPMEALLDSPDYSDLNPLDLTWIFKPEILTEFFQLLDGYTAQENDTLEPKPFEKLTGKEKQMISLSDARGDKPVFMILANPTDVWAWHWTLAPLIQPLYALYGDQIDFYIINTTIHDSRMPIRDFFGTQHKLPKALSAKNNLARHSLSLEERARQCKMFYMADPSFTVPYLLDDMAQHVRDVWQDQGGGARAFLIDRDGTIAFCHSRQDWPMHLNNFYDEFRYARVNEMEAALHHLMQNNGLYTPGLSKPEWPRRIIKKNYSIQRIDPEIQQLTVVSKSGQETVVQIQPRTRITRSDDPIAFDDLKPGDPIEFDYWQTDAQTQPVPARTVQVRRSWFGNLPMVWLSGTIKEIDEKNEIVTVELNPIDPEKCYGLQFWEEAQGAKPDASTAARLKALRYWIDHPVKCYRFGLDEGSLLFLNGRTAETTALKTGDFIAVQYNSKHEDLDLIRPEHVRAGRL